MLENPLHMFKVFLKFIFVNVKFVDLQYTARGCVNRKTLKTCTKNLTIIRLKWYKGYHYFKNTSRPVNLLK